MKNKGKISLYTNFKVNVIKLIISFSFIFMFAKLYYQLDSLLIKNIFFFIGISAIAWFHRIEYKTKLSVNNDTFQISIKRTFFGYSIIHVKSMKHNAIKTYRVLANKYEDIELKFGIAMYFDLSSTRVPKCRLTPLKR